MKTSVNMLHLAGVEQDSAAWSRLERIYRPLISDWIAKAGIIEGDMDDVCQNVFSALIRGLKNFQHSGREGAFRNWLRNLTINQCRQFRKKNLKHTNVCDGHKAEQFLDELADPKTDLSRRWHLEHDRHVLASILEMVADEFDDVAMYAFHELVICRGPVDQVAEELGITIKETLALSMKVKSRIMQEAAALIN